jgi:predicted NACHT family NTPase
VDTTLGFNVLECTGTTRWHNKFYFMSSEETAIWLEELGEAISLLKEVKS